MLGVQHLVTTKPGDGIIPKVLIPAAVVIGLVMGAFIFISGLAVYGYRQAFCAGNEEATIQNVKSIGAVEDYFKVHHGGFTTLEQLVKDGLLTSKFVGDPVIVDGYALRLTVNPSSPGSDASYVITADPEDECSGKKHFYLDSTSNRVRVSPDRRATATDPFLSR